MAVVGASSDAVREALQTDAPLSGIDGFAGELDGRLVRDVLGRYPLFSEADDPATWSFDPRKLDVPDPVPPGHVRDAHGDEQVWILPDPEPLTDDNWAIASVRESVVDAVNAIEGAPPIAFSGGLDSSILAARLDGPLYVGGFEDSHDVAAARTAADQLDRELRVVEFTHEDIERAVPAVVEATGRTDPMDVQIALSLFLVAEAVAADGHDRLVVGQGADELFGGYSKVATAPENDRIAAETIRGAAREVVETLPGQFERDVLTVRTVGVEPIAPLCSDRVVATALSLPGSLLVSCDERKVALRRAVDFLPAEVRAREKKAVQYGSLLAREFDRLARRAGFKRRMDDHLGRYVDSLLS